MINITIIVTLVSALQSSLKRKVNCCGVWDSVFHMRSPVEETFAPSGPESRVKWMSEPSGSKAVNWYTKFSPKNVCNLFCGT